MAKFKDFIEAQIGLGNLGPTINQLFNDKDFNNQIHGAFVGSDVSGSEQSDTQSYSGHPLHMPSTDLIIPETIRSGRIEAIEFTKNPIVIRLSDGTTFELPYDRFREIKGAQVGKTMTITLQRHPGDKSNHYSTVKKIDISH
jgi:hypothetical protein